MSLDVYLTKVIPGSGDARQAIFIRRDGASVEITRDEWDQLHPGVEPVIAMVNAGDDERTQVYSANITHNLNKMAEAAGIYEALWRPDEIGITKAAQLIKPLEVGLARLTARPEHYKKFNSPNGWGKYEHFVPFVELYLEACQKYPEADVGVCR